MMKDKVIYNAMNYIIGHGLLTEVLPFTKELTTEILRESDNEINGYLSQNSDVERKFLTAEAFEKLNISDFQAKSNDITQGIEFKNPQYDVYIQIGDKHLLEYEIENSAKNYPLDARMQFYDGVLLSKSVLRGMDYNKMMDVVTIWLMNYSYEEPPKFLRTFAYMSTDGIILPYIRHIIVDLTQLDKCANIKLRNLLELMLATSFKNSVYEEDAIMKEAVNYILSKNADENVRLQIEAELKAELDYNSNMSGAEAKGENKERTKNVRLMSEAGMTPEVIADILKISLEEVNEMLGK